MDQLNIYDFLKESDKFNVMPEVWDCTETCAAFTNKYPTGEREYFPVTGEARCIYACLPGNFKTVLKDNVWHTWCKMYVPKERLK